MIVIGSWSDSIWLATKHLLDHPTLRNKVDVFVDEDFKSIDPKILECPWSSGERVLIEAALSLHSPNYQISLAELINWLSPQIFKRLTEALAMAANVPTSLIAN